eukprot:5860148-Alexandrium_andersonii.AAC.1
MAQDVAGAPHCPPGGPAVEIEPRSNQHRPRALWEADAGEVGEEHELPLDKHAQDSHDALPDS